MMKFTYQILRSVVAASALFVLATTPAWALDFASTRIISMHSGKSLDHDVASSKVQLWKAHSGANQQWTLDQQDDGYYEIRNVQTGLCLDIQANNVDIWTNGHYAHMWACHGRDNQRFHINVIPGAGQVTLTTKHTGKCLDLVDWRSQNGATLQQWDCHGGANQRWRIEVQAN